MLRPVELGIKTSWFSSLSLGLHIWTVTKALPVLWHQKLTSEEKSWRPLLCLWHLPLLKKSQPCAGALQGGAASSEDSLVFEGDPN